MDNRVSMCERTASVSRLPKEQQGGTQFRRERRAVDVALTCALAVRPRGRKPG